MFGTSIRRLTGPRVVRVYHPATTHHDFAVNGCSNTAHSPNMILVHARVAQPRLRLTCCETAKRVLSTISRPQYLHKCRLKCTTHDSQLVLQLAVI
jgi:hypothetical protein